MIPIHNIQTFEENLARSFQGSSVNTRKVMGLLFARPTDPTAKTLLPDLNYLHYRSGNYVDFYCVGYVPIPIDGEKPAARVHGHDWYFDAAGFNAVRQYITSETNWKYSGGTELILFNAHFDQNRQHTELDFSHALPLPLGELLEEKQIGNIQSFIETLFHDAEKIKTDNPTSELSLRLIKGSGKKSLIELVFNLLPSWLRPGTKRIYSLGTVNYTK